MNKIRFHQFLDLARRGRPVAPLEPPLSGFASRVAARWSAAPRTPSVGELWEKLCWWGAGAAVAVCVLSALIPPPASEPTAFDILLSVQPSSDSTF